MKTLLLFFLFLACAICNAQPAYGPVVETVYGKVQGKFTDKAQVFTSIPYGSPPVTELRWKDPQPPKPWSGVIQTVDDPPGCPQARPPEGRGSGDNSTCCSAFEGCDRSLGIRLLLGVLMGVLHHLISQPVPCDLPLPRFLCPKRVTEDCLYLNVFTPRTASVTSKFPVMVFIHGGNFIRGYSGGDLYDGQYIANTTNTVVVTINYRLGAIGYLVYGSGSGAITGNYGIKDQRLALKWVQANIANFGGDPNQVTLWGQSAGAISGVIHMASTESSGLFHRAILESEPFKITLKDTDHAKKLGEDFAKELGCGRDDIDCLYSKNITEIAKAQQATMTKLIDFLHVLEVFLQWTPTVDGVELTDQPFTLFAKGKVAPLPTIIGTTSQESIFFIYEGFTKPVSPLEYDAVILAVFTLHYEQVHRRYPPPESGDTRPAAAVLGTQYTFSCPTRYALRGFLNETRAPAWFYVFNHSLSFDGWGKNFSFCDGHSCHGVELAFVFHTATLGGFNYTHDELLLTDAMVQYWTNFAHYGNPNGPGLSSSKQQALLEWPQYDVTSQGEYMRFRTPTSDIIANYLGDKCDFLDSIGYNV